MNVIKVLKKTSNKVEQLQAVISTLCLVHNVRLSKTDIKVLSYFVAYGLKESTDDLLINSGIVTPGPLGNIKTKLKKKGFLKRSSGLNKTYELNMSQNFENGSVVHILLTFDNS